MAIPTSRTHSAAEVAVDRTVCTGCGQCVAVCKDFCLRLENGKACPVAESLFGCLGCGHCMAVCPTGAVTVRGRTLEPEHLFALPPMGSAATYDSLFGLLQQRRSVREFLPAAVPGEQIERILDAARTAPMGLPPSDVNVLVLDSLDKNRAFARDFCEHLKTMRWLTAPWFLTLMRPFWGKANDGLFRHLCGLPWPPLPKPWMQGLILLPMMRPCSCIFTLRPGPTRRIRWWRRHWPCWRARRRVWEPA